MTLSNDIIGGLNPTFNQDMRRLLQDRASRSQLYTTCLGSPVQSWADVNSRLRAMAYQSLETTDRQNAVIAEMAKKMGMIQAYNIDFRA